jgi:hypothetical protein
MKSWVVAVALLLIPVAGAQISCGSGFTSSGACSLSSMNTITGGASVTESGGVITLMSNDCSHCVTDLWYSTKQNIGNFSTSFSFTPNNSSGMAFGIQNVSVCSGGASGELGMSQFDGSGGPNNIFYIKFDLFYGSLTQIYIMEQCTSQGTGGNCNEVLPLSWQDSLLPVQFSLSPVSLTSNAPYTANITYDGYNFCMTLSDSASNSYGPKCWKVNIPAIVGGTTAYVGFGASTGVTNTTPGTLNNWAFASGANALNPTQAGGHTVFAGTMH